MEITDCYVFSCYLISVVPCDLLVEVSRNISDQNGERVCKLLEEERFYDYYCYVRESSSVTFINKVFIVI